LLLATDARCFGGADRLEVAWCGIVRWLLAAGLAFCTLDLAAFTCLVVAMSVATPFHSAMDVHRGAVPSQEACNQLGNKRPEKLIDTLAYGKSRRY